MTLTGISSLEILARRNGAAVVSVTGGIESVDWDSSLDGVCLVSTLVGPVPVVADKLEMTNEAIQVY